MEIICGIYKITNTNNNHYYIGQSRNITNRWKQHKEAAININDDSYEYPLQRAFRKYGINSFLFEVLETCSIDKLNEREQFWIKEYKPEYNQTIGENFNVVPQKLTYEQVQQIQQILINDIEGKISHKKLGEQFGVSGKDTIRDINNGRTWYNPELKYPLHITHADNRYKPEYKCKQCGILIKTNSTYCTTCSNLLRRKVERPSREELKQLIRTLSFTQIGQQFGVQNNSIRKWCDNMNLPRTKKEIKSYSDEEWEKI